MKWLILKTAAAIFAALFGIGIILYQQNSLKESFMATQKIGNSFRSLDTEFIELQRVVLQASYFPYFDNDKVLTQIKKIRSRIEALSKDPYLQKSSFIKTRRDLEEASKRFERFAKTVYDFLTLNASLKNSAIYLPTLAMKAYDIFDTKSATDRRVIMLLSKINAILFMAKNALDESLLKEIEKYKTELQRIKDGLSEKKRIRLLQTSLGHLELFFDNFPTFHIYLDTIQSDDFQHEIEKTIKDFSIESKKDLSDINSIGELFLTLYLISILVVIYFIFRFEKENIKLKKATDQLKKSLTTDHLTGLENRRAYVAAKRRMYHPALIVVNIDRFKHINEFYGSKVGDMVLRQSAQILKEIVPKPLEANLYRLGGDDFGILYEFKSKERTEAAIKEIIKSFGKKVINVDGIVIDISISIGASYANKLLETADMALKHTKASKRRRYTIYDRSIDTSRQISKNIRALKHLKRAIANDDIIPYFQPIVEIESGSVAKYEALARMRGENGTVLEPPYFLDAAREAKLSGEITAAILRETLDIAEESNTLFSVNISAGDIMNPHDRNTILELLRSHEACAKRVVFEIVESEEIEDYELLAKFIKSIRELGCKVAIDDFGSGYSNFEKLLQLRADILKIDGSLVREIDRAEHIELVVRTIVDFAKAAGLKTVAEYVHSEAVFEKIKDIGVDFAQGYLLGKPEPKPEPRNRR